MQQYYADNSDDDDVSSDSDSSSCNHYHMYGSKIYPGLSDHVSKTKNKIQIQL